MQTIQVTGATGVGPYDVYLCDTTLYYCYLISGSTTIPPTIDIVLPPIFEGVSSVIVKLVDLSDGCETFDLYSCPVTPTPTPTLTPTPTSTPTSLCRCVRASNTSLSGGTFELTFCNGNPSGVIYVAPETDLYYCGSNPININNLTIYLSEECVDGSCISATPCPTPSNTPTPSITPTITVTPSITPTISVTPTITPTVTPTMTPTPSPVSSGMAFLFIEPITGATNIGNYLYNNSSPQFFGFTNTTMPSVNSSDFNLEMNLYVNYSGWTNGELPSIISSNVPQVTGGTDSYGNQKIIYNFETTKVEIGTVTTDAWYTWIIPVSLTNNEYQMEIDLSIGNPNIFTSLLTEPSIRTNTFTYTGSTIPPVTYRVYTTYPSTDFYIDNSLDDIYFKGGSVGT